jgi:hypothetical protein
MTTIDRLDQHSQNFGLRTHLDSKEEAFPCPFVLFVALNAVSVLSHFGAGSNVPFADFRIGFALSLDFSYEKFRLGGWAFRERADSSHERRRWRWLERWQ